MPKSAIRPFAENYRLGGEVHCGRRYRYDEAFHHRLGHRLVVKRPLTSHAPAERLGELARALTRLRTVHVARIFDLVAFEATPAVVLEYVAGRSLAETVEEVAPLSEGFVVDVGIQALAGLLELHHFGHVHGSITPKRILLEWDEALGPIAKLVGVDPLGASSPDLSVRARPFLAPELQHGFGADSRSDVYSLTACLYLGLAGTRFFERVKPGDALLRRPRADVSEAMMHVLTRGLRYDPAERFASVSEMLEALHELADARTGRTKSGPYNRGALAIKAALSPNSRRTIRPGRPSQPEALSAFDGQRRSDRPPSSQAIETSPSGDVRRTERPR